MNTLNDLSTPISQLMQSAAPAPANQPAMPAIHITGSGNIINLGDLVLQAQPGACAALNTPSGAGADDSA